MFYVDLDEAEDDIESEINKSISEIHKSAQNLSKNTKSLSKDLENLTNSLLVTEENSEPMKCSEPLDFLSAVDCLPPAEQTPEQQAVRII